MKKSYRIIEHTADVGLKVRGRTFPELLENAALGFFDLMTDIGRIRLEGTKKKKGITRVFRLRAADPAETFLKWLRELLFAFSAKKLVFFDYHFRMGPGRAVTVRANGLKFDPSRHEQKLEIKAVTYHHFELSKKKTGWTATVILDI
jgi:SHS2 domain-containing protein